MLKVNSTDGGKVAAGFEHEYNDCTVRALALAANIPYGEAHARMKAEGRRDRHGAVTGLTVRALDKLPHKVVQIGLPISYTLTLGQAVSHYRKGSYLIIVRGHALALINGVIHDAGMISGPRKRVMRIWRIDPLPPAKPELTQEDINAMWARLDLLEARMKR